MVKVKLAIFKTNKNDEYCQKQTLWYSYVFDHKMRSSYYWKAIEPILELRKIEKSYYYWCCRISPILEPRPLVFPTGFTKKGSYAFNQGPGLQPKNTLPFKPSHKYLLSFFFPKWAE